MNLNGKTAIITGAASGIGAEAARAFVGYGAKVLLTDIQVVKGEALAAELGENARFMRHDVCSKADWEAVVRFAEDTFGPVNVLCNNAGMIIYYTSLEACSEADYRKVVEVNQVSVFFGMQAVVPSMKRAGAGSIINTSSAYGLVAGPGSFPYVASKFAVTGMTKAAAMDLGGYGIRVNSLHPGLIDTPIAEGAPPEITEATQAFAKATPLGRSGQPNEMAEVMAFLASDASSYCTGAAFSADGGWTAS